MRRVHAVSLYAGSPAVSSATAFFELVIRPTTSFKDCGVLILSEGIEFSQGRIGKS
jgi:hypothetical protein